MSWINASSFVKSVFAIFYYHGFEKKGGFLFSNTAFVAPSIRHLFLSLLSKFFTSVSPMAKALRTFIITMKNRNVKVRRMSLARTSSALWCKVTSLLWIQGLIYLQENCSRFTNCSGVFPRPLTIYNMGTSLFWLALSRKGGTFLNACKNNVSFSGWQIIIFSIAFCTQYSLLRQGSLSR